MIDIKIIRENPSLIRNDLKKRKDTDKLKLIEELLKKDKEWRDLKKEVDKLRYERNKISEKIESQ